MADKYRKPDWAIGQVRRESGLVEDTCEHGIGHPNLDWLTRHGKEGSGIHGCDGCCRRPDSEESARSRTDDNLRSAFG